MWYQLLDLQSADAGGVRARVVVPGGSPWFSGHFPDNPILPGIAQLHLTAEVIARATCEQAVIERVSRVKFKRIVRPDEPLDIVRFEDYLGEKAGLPPRPAEADS